MALRQAAYPHLRPYMRTSDILAPERVRCDIRASSKKRVLEALSELLSAGHELCTPRAVFDSLCQRERLGSTGLGSGVALPHARLADIEHAVGAFLKTREGIDFDAPDGAPVDLVFGLLVPQNSTDEHLQILSRLAEAFSDERLRERLRREDSPQAMYAVLAEAIAAQ